MKTILAITLCLFVCALQTSCEPRTCTLIGCSSGYSITVNLPSGHLATQGHYVATAGTFQFEFDISSMGGISSDCQQGTPSTVGWTCPFFLGTRGDPPSSVEVVITRDSTEVLRQTVPTNPQEIFPNGVECGAVCSQGAASVTLP